jgi:hypothetical protein
MRGQSVR